MKEQVIQAAGKTWQLLGQKGEMEVTQIPKLLNEKNEIVFQALGWLAREDKISYAAKSKKTFVALVESEISAFQTAIQNIEASAKSSVQASSKKASKSRLK